MHAQAHLDPAHHRTRPNWRTILLIIILLIFAITAQSKGMATEVIVLLITTVTTAVSHLFGFSAGKEILSLATPQRSA
ncbi:hypothetical protein ACIBHY_39410 [Nonomuraea sp. NPDC050547]|uniref:hypothetical protein n=1 Tax=Nonomuraea sp. NPDC050547 TaxID=3364368 RepID=UPI0037ADF73D